MQVENLKTYYFTYRGVLKAVDGVTLDLKQNQAVGIAGESACGKTTLGTSLMRLVGYPGRIVDGSILLDGTDILKMSEKDMAQIRGGKISMVYQSAMNALDPVYKISDQLIEAILAHQKVSRTDAKARMKELMDIVRIDYSMRNSYPHEYSGGMRQRVVIAMALANNPRILILDEPTTALDVVVQAQILGLVNDLREKLGMSIILITHDIGIISEMCEKSIIMYAGKTVEYVDATNLVENVKHPYSTLLAGSFPKLYSHERKRLTSIPGAPPDLVSPPSGCRFHPRCPRAMMVCKNEEPDMKELEQGHMVACHLFS